MKQKNQHAPNSNDRIPGGLFHVDGVPFDLMYVNSSEIISPIEDFQRGIREKEVIDIVNDFSEYIANEPKLAYYRGHYYVFDGQHTVAARIIRNHNRPLDILCKVYYDLTPQMAARLFAKQTGYSSKPTSGEHLRAMKFSEDQFTLDFIDATRAAGLVLSYSDTPGLSRIRCINTAMKMYIQVGREHYVAALQLIRAAWNGIPESLLREVICSVCRFEALYHGEYDRVIMMHALTGVSPYYLVDATYARDTFKGIKNAMRCILELYNKRSTAKPLPLKF